MSKMYGSFQNRILETCKPNETIEIGMGATEIGYSDRHPYTLIEIKSPARVIVQADIAIRIDNNDMSDLQEYEYHRNIEGVTVELIKTKNGWKEKGSPTRFILGLRDKHYDYSF